MCSPPQTPTTAVRRSDRLQAAAALGERGSPRGTRRPPSRVHHLARRDRLSPVVSQGSADRPAVGEGRPRNPRRHLPWGSQRTPAKVNCREGRQRSTTPVDYYASGVSPYGAYDMCGNTWEWCSTESEPGRYELKGSAFTSPFLRCTPSTFNDAAADMLDDDTGFRCVTPAETMRAVLNMRDRPGHP
ncbi:SUMF1/EgtB/PvdO family nonheme iron enzyme [Spirillospora sp. NPDC029432]|uniref:SUMF1/EgtB/PvdO family nonheme iron enzyme n=1 Tax=Spirillospora sp. NPDC029432 TaxID=3154599 RepID=UPI0034542E23